MWVYVWTKTVFWSITQSYNCNIRRNIDFPSDGENSWVNFRYKNLKYVSVQITLIIGEYFNMLLL
jgi:hypothetical protein